LVRRPDAIPHTLTLAPSAPIEVPSSSQLVGHWSDEHGAPFASARVEGSDRWIEWPGVGVFAFRIGSAVVHVAPQTRFDEVRDLFARVLQPVVLQALGRQALHASAVLGGGGVLAFCGRGRTGKSTLAYALATRGFQQVADDAVLIDAIGTGVSVRTLPFVPQLRAPSRQYFRTASEPDLTERSGVSPSANVVAPLRGVFILEQSPAVPSPVAERLPPVRAFAVLLPHAHCFDQRPSLQSASLVDDYLRLVERVPVFTLTYAPSFCALDTLVQSVDSLAAELGVCVLTPAAGAAQG
jgi:hypothetical protein